MNGMDETKKKKLCNFFISFENAKSSPFCLLVFLCIWSLKRIDPFIFTSITYHRTFHSLIFFIVYFPSCVCFCFFFFHLTAHSTYTKIIVHSLIQTYTYVNGYDEKSKYPNLLVVSLKYVYERKQTPNRHFLQHPILVLMLR